MTHVIGVDDCPAGNRAMASVLLLYFHLLREGGITNDQTVYIDADDFDPFAYASVEVAPELDPEIDQALLREGAVVFLLCDLYDVIGEHGSSYLELPWTARALACLSVAGRASVPEVGPIVEMVASEASSLDQALLQARVAEVYQRYVVARMRALVPSS